MVPVYWELAIQGGADRFVYRHNVLSVNTFPPVADAGHTSDDVDVLSFRNIETKG